MGKTIAAALFVLVGIGIIWHLIPAQERPQKVQSDPKVASEIKGISALQTNPNTGEVEYRLQAVRLTQSTTGQNILEEVQMVWTPTKETHYTITANLATFDEQTGDFVFYDGFRLQRQSDETAPLLLVGDTLRGNTKTKLIKSDTPLQVTQDQHQFLAQAMTGDLSTKEYDFYRVMAEFNPPVRKDTALF